MAIHTVPLRTDLEHYELQMSLDGVTYTLEFRWSGREECWYLDVREEGGEPIYCGIKCVIEWPLGKRCRDERFPAGILIAVDTSGERTDPRVDDFGERVKLLYFEADELPDLGA